MFLNFSLLSKSINCLSSYNFNKLIFDIFFNLLSFILFFKSHLISIQFSVLSIHKLQKSFIFLNSSKLRLDNLVKIVDSLSNSQKTFFKGHSFQFFHFKILFIKFSFFIIKSKALYNSLSVAFHSKSNTFALDTSQAS
jgi:hypothetical protein